MNALSIQMLAEAPEFAAYGPNQPDWPSAVMKIPTAMGAADVSNSDPPSPGIRP